MVYGYVRISTAKQNLERQIRNITERYSDAKIYKEIFTGKKRTGRKEYEKLLNKVTSGDVIVFDSVSRMSRNAEEGYETYMALYDKGVDLVFLNEPYVDTKFLRTKLDATIADFEIGNGPTKVLIEGIIEQLKVFNNTMTKESIKLAFEQAQKEVDDLSERTKQGLVTARNNGKQIGRPAGEAADTKKATKAKEEMKRLCKDFGGSNSDKEVMAILKISKNTFYKYKKELTQK